MIHVQHFKTKGGFPVPRRLYERQGINVKVEPRSTRLRIIRVKFAYHFRINYDLNLETAEFLELGLCDFGETLFSARH